jgi:glutamate synthase domain-containing protein 3
MPVFDLAVTPLRELNSALHAIAPGTNDTPLRGHQPARRHAVAVGIDGAVTVDVRGNVGYYCAGMNDGGVRDRAWQSAGPGVAENMMSAPSSSRAMPASTPAPPASGGLLVIKGNAASRCGISMKGIDIVVQGNIGHMSAFMGQSGHLVVLGDAGDALGDSLYEAKLFVRGTVKSLGADCIEKEMRPEHCSAAGRAAGKAGLDGRRSPEEFKRYGSARTLYNFNIDNAERVLRSGPVHELSQSAYTPPRRSRATFDDYTLAEIRRAAATGIYDIRGGGTKRKVPHFDDLLFLGASISRYPLEGYREKCDTDGRAGHALRQEADHAEDADHHRRHELRRALGQGQGSARARRHHRRAHRPPPATAA